MNDTAMIKISLILVLTGLPLLALASHASIPMTENSTLLSDQETVNINGTLGKIQNRGELTRAVLQTCMQIPLVMFDPVRLEDQRRVKIIGKKENYKGSLQIIVDQLEYV